MVKPIIKKTFLCSSAIFLCLTTACSQPKSTNSAANDEASPEVSPNPSESASPSAAQSSMDAAEVRSLFLLDDSSFSDSAGHWENLPPPPSTIGQYDGLGEWTGDSLLAWGGETPKGVVGTGAIFNFKNNTWQAISSIGEATYRRQGCSAWTGDELFVWGGFSFANSEVTMTKFNDGGLYNPVSDSWSQVTSEGAPSARFDCWAFWTGTKVLVWSGQDGSYLYDGGLYDPVTHKWSLVKNDDLPHAGFNVIPHFANGKLYLSSDAAVLGKPQTYFVFDPAAESWSQLQAADSIFSRDAQTNFQIGDNNFRFDAHDGIIELRVVALSGATAARFISSTPWGGNDPYGAYAYWGGKSLVLWTSAAIINHAGKNLGVLFNPSTSHWTPVSAERAPQPRGRNLGGLITLWTGSTMIVAGAKPDGENWGFVFTP